MFQFVRIKYLDADVTPLYSLSKFCGLSLRSLFLFMRAVFQGSKYRTTPYGTDCVCEHSELLTLINDACRISKNAFGNLSAALRSTEPRALRRRWSERSWTRSTASHVRAERFHVSQVTAQCHCPQPFM